MRTARKSTETIAPSDLDEAPPRPRNRGGRPAAKIDLDNVRSLGRLHCTMEEAAAFFDVDLTTLYRRFRDPAYKAAWEQGRAEGCIHVRRLQLHLAKRNAAMCIWLGKVLLGQRDVVRTEVTGADGGPVEVSDARRRLEDLVTRYVEIDDETRRLEAAE